MKWSLRKAISCYAFASLQSPYMVTAYALVSQRAALLYLGIYLLIYVQQHNRNLKTSWRESVVDSLTLVLFWICHVLDHYSLAGEGETKIWRIGISRVFISDEGDLLCKLTQSSLKVSTSKLQAMEQLQIRVTFKADLTSGALRI